MQVNELFTQPNTILLDGGMGTMLQAAGLQLGARPEELNITDPEAIQRIHGMYAAAGSRIINTNTFGASAHKLAGSAYTLEEVIAAGIANCKRACAPYGALAALDVGPLGELLEPNGTLAFEDAVAEFGRIVRAGVAAGADLVFFETFTDLYELKAALLAAKENSTLPILASMSFEAGGRTFTGCTVESFADADGMLRAQSGWTDIFIYPGYQFKCMDALVTNFHLPESTLIMLVSALAGREHILNAYKIAVENRYRFFSFGDAMFIADGLDAGSCK